MAIRHTVRRGDSLWGLACRYLGSGAKWPAIWECHNLEAAKLGRPELLLPIKDPNLIYVGQYVMIPGDRRTVPTGSGARHEAARGALPIDLKITYTIGRGTPPVAYRTGGVDFTVTTRVSGHISVELLSADRYRHSLELFMSKDPAQAKVKLQEAYDPAIKALTVEPEVGFDPAANRVRIKAPIAAEAGLGPYAVEVNAVTPLHLSGMLRPATAQGMVEAEGRRYKYSAKLEFKVDVELQPKPRGRGDEMVRVAAPKPKEEIAVIQADGLIDWQKIATTVEWTIIGIGLAILGCRAMPTTNGTTSIQPMLHIIDPRNPCNRRCFNKNA
jgi:LysM domain